eukprot:TRINITY_DN922_c0_g1_i2.p1 TRINITY_DN922_c0_g1~~TRINITY_DN922_c0_g1_i2.p1  ORF type:complete len:285 (-),score=75.69 TRINITY_DN922_c0_g1_i2:1175-1921(-)
MSQQQPAPRRSKRQHKSVAELERRAREVFQEEGEQLYEGSDASVDLADLSDQEDEVDSDFDREEEVGDAEQEAKQAERELRRAERAERVHTQKRKVGAYVDAASRTERKERKVRRTSGATHVQKGLDRSSLRKSTRVASARAAERRAINEKKKPRERRVEHYEVPTQQQRLQTARMTEVLNRNSLKDLLRLEEEKKRVVVKKKTDVGESMSTKWKHGSCTISFTKGVSSEQIREVMLGHSDEDEEESE